MRHTLSLPPFPLLPFPFPPTKLLPIPSLLVLVLLTACEKSLDTAKIAQTIQDDVIKQGGLSLKAVTCPKQVKPEAEKTFECTGEIDTGYTFTVSVKQKDDQGSVTWDVPNTKGMLNVAKFETSIQEAIQGEVGSRPIIRCGDGFKPIKPGQIFECKVLVKDKPKNTSDSKASKTAKAPLVKNKPTKPDIIVASVDADGNVNWQRVMPGAVSQLLPKPAPTTQPAGNAATPTAPAAPPPPAQKSAEDFLNQPGAADGF